ncbi:uncharacterized protein pdgfbb isoform X2 [Toxotes jaculatrix]|nr:uncharacterized protein pdgfbb isoform X2 [Toxotes jaculatrix]
MLDRSNANFLLWPPCVEVQRCSGCCNTKSLQCVPVVTHTRYLQVMKIEYINKRPTYAKAVVSVVDHVECRCQPAPRPPVHKKKSSRRQHSHQHRNQTLSQEHGQGQVKMHSKDELHQWDELKQNQRAHLEDLLEQHWSPRGDTFTQPGEGYSLAGEGTSRSGEATLFTPHWAHNSSRLHETENPENVQRKDGGISGGNKTVSSVDVGVEHKNKLVEGGNGLLLNSTEGEINEGNGGQDKETQTHSPLLQGDKSKFTKSRTSGIPQPVTQSPQAKFIPTEEIISEKVGSRFRPTKEPNPEPREQVRRRENETPEEERILQIEEAKLEEEKKELLLLHKRLDQEKEILRQQQMKREEEERQKEKGLDGQHHLHGKHHHLQTTTQKPETTTSTTTTRKPSAPAGPRPPARPNHTRKRMRKNRKRISKAAMRAMLM